jgi:serralysin
MSGDGGNDTILGAAGADSLSGGQGFDSILGRGGNDTLDGGEGADTLDGGEDFDIAAYAGTTAVTVALDGSLTATGDAVGDVFVSIEGLIGSDANDLLGGDGGDNLIDGTLDLPINPGTPGTPGLGNDTLLGFGGNDTLFSGYGQDSLDGGEGFDIAAYSGATGGVYISLDGSIPAERAGSGDTLVGIEGLVGSDNAFPGNGDLLVGDANANLLDGQAGNDTLRGQAGDDTLEGGAGADLLGDDTIGFNWLSYASDTVGVDIDLQSNLARGGDGQGDSIVGATFAGLIGGSGNDTLVGRDNVADTLLGGGGNDSLAAFGTGNEVMDGGEGDDTLVGGDENDSLRGGDGSDSIIGGAGRDTIDLRAGNGPTETVDGGADNDLIFLGGSTHTVQGGTGIDTADGTFFADNYLLDLETGTTNFGERILGIEIYVSGGGRDTILGSSVANLILGGGGDDSLNGRGGDDTLEGGTGNDTLVGESSASTFLLGGNDADSLVGGTGADTLDGGAGIDRMAGGAGHDRYVITAGDVVTEAVNGGRDTVVAALAAVTLGANLEDLVGTAATAQTLFGNTLANSITGGIAADTLAGGAGADTLTGGAGIDRLLGGTEADHYIIDTIGDLAIEAPNQGIDTVRTSLAAHTLALNVENLLGTASTAQALTGNTLANAITGGTAADTLIGGAGADTLRGGVGIDRLLGGTEGDTYVIDTAGDLAIEALNQGIDTVRTSLAAYTLTLNVENLLGTAATGQRLIGNTLANSITGGMAGDTLEGGGGNDTLTGGAGIDRLLGGTDNDTYIIDTVGDLAIEALNQGIDTVRTSLSIYTLALNIENLVGTAMAGQTLAGNALANRVTGSGGNDTIVGGGGADTLTGGAGADRFRVSAAADSPTASPDRVADFVFAAGDRVDLSFMDANALLAGNQAFAFIGAAAFSGTGAAGAGQLRAGLLAPGLWRAQGDTDGNGLADFSIDIASATGALGGWFLR